MNLRAIAVVFVLSLLVLFAMANWGAFSAQTTLTLGFSEVSAPLGLIMLGVTALLSVLFLVYIVFQQAGALLESRRHEKELLQQRDLAEKAEVSRISDLRAFLEIELRRIEAQGTAATRETGACIERLDRAFEERLAESTRTLSAYLGEVEDKLDRVLAGSTPADQRPQG
jgi:biopolymer transport protein ExbB/TolQ